MSRWPSISVIIPTYNSEKVLERCLESIKEQDYPKERIEVIVVDGGSRDATIDIAEAFGSKVLNKSDQENPEKRKALGLAQAKNDLVAFIDSDNILPHREWLKKMTSPLLENEEVIATQPLRYTYDRTSSLLNRYFALFGVNDPLAYYFNKRDRLSWAEDTWRLWGKASDKGNYFLVKFTPDKVPTLGANGYLVRRDILLKARCHPDDFFHIDVNCDLIGQGYNTYAIIKDDILHLTSNTFFSFLLKRMKYMRRYYIEDRPRRRYSLYTPKDRGELIRYILLSLTIVKPLYDSFRGFRKIRDSAWFLHPIMCLAILFAYSLMTLEWAFQSLFNNIKKGARKWIRISR